MKDREKQIEEVETIIKSNLAEGSFANAFARKVASQIVEHYQSKLTKDSVVLSKEEYERLKRVEAEKDRLYEIKLDLENQLIEKGWTDYEGADEIEKRVRKETAKKWYNKVKELYLKNVGEQVFEHNWFGVQINKFARQFDVEVDK